MSIYNSTTTNKSLLLALFTSLLFTVQVPNAQAASTPEDKIKTAIIYKITKFITWPKKSQSLTICILGEGSINNELKRINRKNTMGRRLSITHKDANAPFEKLCDALFIHKTDSNTVSTILDKLKGKPVLTISDTRSFTEKGGIIGLNRSGKKINFSINNSSAKTSKLSISSKLLKLAKAIK